MYQVEWLQSALDELATLWTTADAALRQAVTAASNDVDKRLRSDPNNEGESRPRGRRITFVPPLAVVFRVDTANRVVTVVEVRMFRRRTK